MLILVERQGKQIKAGSIVGRRWEKNLAVSKNTLRLENGTLLCFGLDKELYDRLKPDFDRFFWYDTDTNHHYILDRASLDELIKAALVISWSYRDHGAQWAIPFKYWSIGGNPPAESPTVAVSAFRERSAATQRRIEEMRAPVEVPQLSLF